MNKDEILTRYKQYMDKHRINVRKAYDWLKENTPEIIDNETVQNEIVSYGILEENINNHDLSRYENIEFEPYAIHFMGKPTEKDTENFINAWIYHAQFNPHHWQYWNYFDDDGKEIRLDMGYICIVEMFCNHWSFCWEINDLNYIFEWYPEQHFEWSENTQKIYEKILLTVEERTY